ncbi:hypothetical protein [Pengzhenrongella sp.]|jgi:uncharacterized alkaline shock family protein YloU|uniref:hypothetical protein n=1 Tax=Pengzhenrongella sp. TaxID=2888820 RepID=UPI002F9375EE
MTDSTSQRTPAGTGTTAADPDVIAAAALGCPSVARLSGGLVGEVATYLPGRRVRGVRVRDNGVSVHVVGVYGPPVTEIAREVHAAVTGLAAGLPVEVVVDDLDVDPDAHRG